MMTMKERIKQLLAEGYTLTEAQRIVKKEFYPNDLVGIQP